MARGSLSVAVAADDAEWTGKMGGDGGVVGISSEGEGEGEAKGASWGRWWGVAADVQAEGTAVPNGMTTITFCFF
jgi:hypothetical protein